MPSAFVVLIAGAGHKTSRRSVRYHQACVRATGKRSPRIAYVGAASGDSRAFRITIATMVFGIGATVLPVDLTRRGRTSAIRDALASADLVFFSGGDVERGMRAFEERDLGAYVRALAAQGQPMEGLSAGAILLGAHWVRFSGKNESVAEPFACLGVVPASFDTHGENDAWQELRALARVLPKSESERVVYGIPSGGAARWDSGHLRALGEPLAQFTCGIRPRRLNDVHPSREGPRKMPAKSADAQIGKRTGR